MTRQKESSITRFIKFESLVFILGLLALATVTRGGVAVELVPNPDQAGYSPNQMVQVDFKLARLPSGADQRLRMVELDLLSTIPFLAPALPLTHDRGTPGTDHSYTKVPLEHADNANSRNDMNASTTNDYRSNDSTSGHVIVSEEHRDLVLDDVEGGTARGDVCNDNNVCTNDSITPTNECLYTFNSNPCDDNSACTTNDHCFNGSCRGTTFDCNDSNECTDDSCNPSSGCVHANNSNSCTDGLFCNGRESCSGGNCGSHTGDPCPPNTTCDEATRSCGPSTNNSVISFKAVKKNNVPITPGTCNLALVPPMCSTGNVNKLCASDAECHVGTNILEVLGNDTIEVEIFLSRWAEELPAGVRLFQVKLDGNGFVGRNNGTALPIGWCAPVNRIDCTDSSACPPTYPICTPSPGCTCAGHNPDLGAFIATSRTDYLLSGVDEIFDVVTSSLSFLYFGLAIDSVGVPDPGVPTYLGSLILKVSANACGTFTIGFVQEINSTFIADPEIQSNSPNAVLPAMQPLFLTVSDCSRQLLSCYPGHCNIDARIAHDRLDLQTKLNTNTIEMTFSKPTTGMTAADIEITLVPTLLEDILPGFLSVTPVVGNPNKATILLNRRIQQTRWTCIRDKGSNKRCCMGSLPADADDNRVSQSADTFEVYDNLQGSVIPALKIDKCDTDRSLQCSPADLLMVVDLLNGADTFTEVNGDSLEVCPAMRPPP